MNFLTVKNQTDTKAEVMIYGDIVDDSWNFGWEDDPNVYPKNIKSMLTDFGDKDLDVHINSGGGHVFAGMAISNMLKQYKGKTTAYIDGIAASAASLIAFGCNEVVIPANAFLMIHKPSCAAVGNADDMLKCVEMLEAIQKGSVATYMAKAVEGVTSEQVNEMINAETWLTGAESTAFFNIQVGQDLPVLNCYGDISKYQHAPKLLIKKPQDQTKKMEQEIEIALAL